MISFKNFILLAEGNLLSLQKAQYSFFTLEQLKQLASFDPSYDSKSNDGLQTGKFTRWIIDIANKLRKTGQKFEDTLKKLEELSIKDCLQASKSLKLNLQEIKTFELLKKIVDENAKSDTKVPTNKLALEIYNVMQKLQKDERFKIIFEDNKWIVGTPLTFAASKKFGEFSSWCTTSNTRIPEEEPEEDDHDEYDYRDWDDWRDSQKKSSSRKIDL